MKLYKTIFSLIIAGVIFSACKSDDNDGGIELLPQDVQNRVDDEAIKIILQKYYFNDQGKITLFSDTDSSDDNRTPLSELAVYNPMGFWTVKKEGYEADGRKVTNVDRDDILLQYEMFTFQGKTNSRQDSTYYTSPVKFSSTIDAKGYPLWNPDFYFKKLTETNVNNGVQRSWYEMEGFQEGIKEFNSANKNITDEPFVDFQGLIIFPSRLGFGRDVNNYNFIQDQSVMINFQLYQVKDKE